MPLKRPMNQTPGDIWTAIHYGFHLRNYIRTKEKPLATNLSSSNIYASYKKPIMWPNISSFSEGLSLTYHIPEPLWLYFFSSAPMTKWLGVNLSVSKFQSILILHLHLITLLLIEPTLNYRNFNFKQVFLCYYKHKETLS